MERAEQLENFTSWLIEELLGWDDKPFRLAVNAIVSGFTPAFLDTIFSFTTDEWIEISEFADDDFLTQEETDRVTSAILHHIEETNHEI